MKILLVTNYQPPHMGGVECAAQSLKACWERDGHEVTWLTTDIPVRPALSTHDNVRIPANNILEKTLQINSPIIYPWGRSRISKLIASHDVVNVHSLAPGLSNVALNMSLRARKPMVVTQHVGVIPLPWMILTALQRTFVTAAARRTLRGNAFLTFVGRAVREWFEKEARLDPSKLFMTPAGIDQADFHFVDDVERRQFQEKWKRTSAKLNVLYVGRFYEKKGLSLIRELAIRCPEIHFTLVGGGPIKPASWNLPNVQKISFVSTSELRELYGSHDLFIMPSYGEGWPAVVPQAMACGLACLISEECFTGYAKDEDRFIVCKRNVDEISRHLKDAAGGKIPLLSARQELSQYASAIWNWQTTARIYAELFERVIKASATPR